MKYNRICILDTETTSVYWNSAAPVQIAAEIVDGNGEIIDSFNERIKTTHAIDPEASKVHGIYKEDLEFCRRESEVLTDFCEWMKQNEVDVVLTYNGEAFDRPMLNCRCKTLQIPFNYFEKENFPGLDCKQLVMEAKRKNYMGLGQALGRKWKLTLVAQHLGFSAEGAHDALVDVEMLRKVFFTLDKALHPEHWNETSDLF